MLWLPRMQARSWNTYIKKWKFTSVSEWGSYESFALFWVQRYEVGLLIPFPLFYQTSKGYVILIRSHEVLACKNLPSSFRSVQSSSRVTLTKVYRHPRSINILQFSQWFSLLLIILIRKSTRAFSELSLSLIRSQKCPGWCLPKLCTLVAPMGKKGTTSLYQLDTKHATTNTGPYSTRLDHQFCCCT